MLTKGNMLKFCGIDGFVSKNLKYPAAMIMLMAIPALEIMHSPLLEMRRIRKAPRIDITNRIAPTIIEATYSFTSRLAS